MADKEDPIYTIKRFRGENKPKGAKKNFFTKKDPRLREDDEKDRGDDENGREDDDKRPGKTGAFMDWGVEFPISR